jgi:Lon protease-like protein
MKRNALEPEIQDLPRVIPIFPLNGALLLPGGRLPLNIFEDRYLNMIQDVLSMKYRVFGMIQTMDHPQPAANDTGLNTSPLHRVGCLGRLSSFEETSDGRNLISLDGLIRFRVLQELEMKNGYRRVEVSYDGYDLDTEATDPEIERDRLVNALRGFFNIKGFTADWNVIERCESERLVTTLSMICPLGFADKQALLEATSTTDRAMKLSTLLEMEISGHELNGDGDNNVFH